MRCLKMIAVILVPLMLSLTGCGGDSSGTTSANNPFATGGGNTSGSSGGTIFGNISTATGKTGISLTTDLSTVDVNNGQVLATARLVSSGVPVSGAPVTFSIIAPTNGPATIEAGLTTVATDSNGVAVTRITTGNVLTTTSVIVQATATLPGGQTATVNTTFQIVRGTGVIAIGDLGLMDAAVDPNFVSAEVFLQQIPFRVTDSNGNPRVGVPVTLSLYSQSGNSTVVIDYLKSPITELNQQTVTTDSSGLGIFNVSVSVTAPSPGLTNTDSIVYKAVTNDAIPVVAYVGGFYAVTSKLPTLTISPAVASFGTAIDLTFNISGGVPSYTVTSSNPGFATAALQADGHTVIAHLVNPAATTGTATISVTDSAGQTASATVTR